MKTNEIREQMIAAREEYINLVKRELFGPGSEFAAPDAEHELISSSPTSRYSVGILYPQGNQVNQDNDETVPLNAGESSPEEEMPEEVDVIDDGFSAEAKVDRLAEKDETADESLDEEVGLSAQYMPSSMGITFLVKGNADAVRGNVSFATYRNAKVHDCVLPFHPDNPEDYSVPPQLSSYLIYDKEASVLRLVAPIRVKGGRSILIERAAGPSPMIRSS